MFATRFWQIVSAILLVCLLVKSCWPEERCPDAATVYHTDTILKPYDRFISIPQMYSRYVTLHDTVKIDRVVNALTDDQKDSLLGEYLGIKVFTREYADTVITAVLQDTIEDGKLHGSMTYRLKKPLVTILPETKKNKIFIGLGAFGNTSQMYVFPEVTFMSKKDYYLNFRYDPITRSAGFGAGVKIGK
jgi:hypothetical protein